MQLFIYSQVAHASRFLLIGTHTNKWGMHKKAAPYFQKQEHEIKQQLFFESITISTCLNCFQYLISGLKVEFRKRWIWDLTIGFWSWMLNFGFGLALGLGELRSWCWGKVGWGLDKTSGGEDGTTFFQWQNKNPLCEPTQGINWNDQNRITRQIMNWSWTETIRIY